MAKRPKTCPACGSRIIPVVYGMPDIGLVEAADRGEVEIGGCIVNPEMPTHVCTGEPAHSLRGGVVVEDPNGIVG
jgi:hypothetical protein